MYDIDGKQNKRKFGQYKDDNQRMAMRQQLTTQDNQFAADFIHQTAITAITKPENEIRHLRNVFSIYIFPFANQFSVDLMSPITIERVNNCSVVFALDGRCTYAIFVQSKNYSPHYSNF